MRATADEARQQLAADAVEAWRDCDTSTGVTTTLDDLIGQLDVLVSDADQIWECDVAGERRAMVPYLRREWQRRACASARQRTSAAPQLRDCGRR